MSACVCLCVQNEEFGLNDINTRDYETGVEYSSDGRGAQEQAPVLSDRLTQRAARRVVDHPSFFAKGVEDSTPGGAYLSSAGPGSTAIIEQGLPQQQQVDPTPAEPWYSTESLPLGWVALKPGQSADQEEGDEDGMAVETHVPSFVQQPPQQSEPVPASSASHRRTFSPDDKNLKFDPREEFAGRRAGFVYRMGLMGLGYYEDVFGKALEEVKIKSSVSS